MDVEELLFQESLVANDENLKTKRDRLLSLIISGKSRMFLGHQYSPEDIEKMKPQDIDALYVKYENALGAKMTRNLGKTIINLYTKAASHLFTIDCTDALNCDLESNPVIANAVGSLSCWLYFYMGNYLASLMAGLITTDHISFNERKKISPEENGPRGDTSNNGDQTEEPRQNTGWEKACGMEQK